MSVESAEETIGAAIDLIVRYGQIDGEHHKTWVLDQVLRKLAGSKKAYDKIVRDSCAGEDGPDTYSWDVGTPP